MVKLFAVGNFMYPKSRYSVGMQVVERLAKSSKNSWFADKASMCNVSELGNRTLAIPLTYLVHENVSALRLCMKNRKLNVDDITVITYSTDLEFGTMRLDEGGPTAGHLALEPIFEFAQTEIFKRLSIGIAHPPNMGYNPDALLTHQYDDDKYNSFFLCNKFPSKEQFILDEILLPAAESLLLTENHDLSHSYSYQEVMLLADRIKSNTAKKLQFDQLKAAQQKEMEQARKL
jgi:peptidyl-tRNA hydrolase